MFTGLIETVQKVRYNRPAPVGRELCVSLGDLSRDAKPGDSICVNGVCLTISRLQGGDACFDVMQETIRSSVLGELGAGDFVNLERAVQIGGRLGGHFVQGHVDGIGTIESIEKNNQNILLGIGASPEIMRFMIEKGSVAVNGISLTIAHAEPHRFHISIIPTTWRDTNLQFCKTGNHVNLEADIICKMIYQQLSRMLPSSPGQSVVDMDKLRNEGFV